MGFAFLQQVAHQSPGARDHGDRPHRVRRQADLQQQCCDRARGVDREMPPRLPIELGAESFTVIGVASSAFENVLAPAAGVWTLLQYDPSLPLQGREWGHHLRMVGRLRPDVGMDQARRDLDTIARAPSRITLYSSSWTIVGFWGGGVSMVGTP